MNDLFNRERAKKTHGRKAALMRQAVSAAINLPGLWQGYIADSSMERGLAFWAAGWREDFNCLIRWASSREHAREIARIYGNTMMALNLGDVRQGIVGGKRCFMVGIAPGTYVEVVNPMGSRYSGEPGKSVRELVRELEWEVFKIGIAGRPGFQELQIEVISDLTRLPVPYIIGAIEYLKNKGIGRRKEWNFRRFVFKNELRNGEKSIVVEGPLSWFRMIH